MNLPVFFVDYVLDPQRPGASGLSDIVWDIAEELARQGGEPHVFGPYASNPRPASGVQLHTVRIPPPGYRNVLGRLAIVVATYLEIRRLGRRGVVHTPEYLASGVIASLAPDLPVVLTVPGSIFQKLATRTNPYDAQFTCALKLTARLSARHCARVIATSADMARWWLRTGTPPRRLVQLPLGVDTALFRRRPAARQELGLDDAPLVLGVGRINRENDFGTLLEGFAQVVSDYPRARLHLVGDGPELPTLRERAERLRLGNNITWHGWVDRIGLARLYSAADAFAFTALTAGLPRVVLEAMACAAPIVATTVPGVVDHLIDGRTGYLFSPGDADALAAKLSLLLGDRGRAAELGAAVGRYTERELSWSTITRRQIDLVYRPLLERARAA